MIPRPCPDDDAGRCTRDAPCRYDIDGHCTRCPDCAGEGHAIMVIDAGHRGAMDLECPTCYGGGRVPVADEGPEW